MAANSKSWQKIADDIDLIKHDFSKSPLIISSAQIKKSCQEFTGTSEKEVRILCKQDSRFDRPSIFKENDLFILPIKNGNYAIVKGEGYIDIPKVTTPPTPYVSKLDFELETSKIGSSEMQHLDFAYASSLIRTFTNDPSLVLTIRGRKFTPSFTFKVCGHILETASVQTEVDGGYEGKEQIVLIEAKNSGVSDTIIRQLYYPYRQWQTYTKKKVTTLFFDKDALSDAYSIWQFEFEDINSYNSIKLVKSGKFKIQ